MGWPLAVSAGLMERSSRALVAALWPLTVGHLLAMLVVILPFSLLVGLVRNIAYVVFVTLLVPFGMLMEAAGPQGPDSGGGIMAAIILWGVVSLIFFIANAGLLISSVARGRPAMKPLIACALPIVCVVFPLVLEPFFVR